MIDKNVSEMYDDELVEYLGNQFDEIKAVTANITLDRLEEICNAERDGLCVVLPCKVGDMTYHIDVSIEPNDRGKWITKKRIKAEKFYYGMLDWIETPLYFSREEAEQALKGGAE